MRTVVRRLTAVTAAVVVVGAAAGCGADGKEDLSAMQPTTAVSQGVENLADNAHLEITVQPDGTAGAWQGFLRSAAGAATAAKLDPLRDAKLTVIVTSDGEKPFGDYQPGHGRPNEQITFDVGDHRLLDLRYVDDHYFVRADASRLLPLLGLPGSSLDALRRLPKAGAALAGGGWLEIEHPESPPVNHPLSQPSHPPHRLALHSDFLASFRQALLHDVHVTRTVKSDTNGDQYVLTGHANAIVGDLMSLVRRALPPGTLNGSLAHQVPDVPLTLHALTTRGTLRQVTADLAQFVPKDALPPNAAGEHTMPVEADLATEAPEVSAPPSPTPITQQQWKTLMSGLHGALG